MLRIATLALFLVVSPVRAGTPLEMPDVEALKAFRLTSDNVRKAAAVTHRLAIEAAKDPAFARFLAKKREQGESLEDQAKALERDARVAGALRAESIGAREYVMVQIAAVQGNLLAAVRARGVKLEGSDVRDALNPANLDFVETHRKEMDELGRSQHELQKVSEEALGEEK